MTKKNYINNEELLKSLKAYKKEKAKATKTGAPVPPIPDDIGVAILQIARGLARKPNFSAYTFKEEMISDGIQNCFQYIDNFDPAISSNPFSYFTQIIYYAFLRRIEFESKQTYVKFKSFEAHDLFTNHQYESKKHVNLIHSIINEKTQDIITKFESKMESRSISVNEQEQGPINLELFME